MIGSCKGLVGSWVLASRKCQEKKLLSLTLGEFMDLSLLLSV